LIPFWQVWAKIGLVHVALPKLPKNQFKQVQASLNQFRKVGDRH
jgi:hypothetical protein